MGCTKNSGSRELTCRQRSGTPKREARGAERTKSKSHRGVNWLMSRRNLFLCLVVLVALVNIVNLLPLLDSPYLGDDAWCESTLKGLVELSGITLPKLCWNVVVDYVRDGRWYPAIVYYYPVFYYLDRYLYKLATLLFILSNIFVFGYFVSLTTSSKSAGLISALLPPLFFQLRFYHDPLLSYYFLMQVEFLLLVGSLIFFTWHLRSGRKAYLVGSVATYALSLLVYEAFYGFLVMYGVIAYFHFGRSNFRKIAKVVLPFLVVFCLNACLILVIRSVFVVHYEGIHLNLVFSDWILAFMKQLVAAVPLSYYTLTNAFSDTLEYARVYFANDLFVIFCLWAIAWGFTSLFCADARGSDTSITLRPLILLGLGFWVLPAPIVTLSAKYQKELTWGLGYLPVYVSGFGLMMLATFLIMQVYVGLTSLGNRWRFGILAGIGAIACLVCVINYNNNRIVSARVQLQRALPQGAHGTSHGRRPDASCAGWIALDLRSSPQELGQPCVFQNVLRPGVGSYQAARLPSGRAPGSHQGGTSLCSVPGARIASYLQVLQLAKSQMYLAQLQGRIRRNGRADSRNPEIA